MTDVIKPMEPILKPEPFDDPEYLYQVKWDGVRMIAFADGDEVFLQNRQLSSRTDAYPDITAAIREQKLDRAIIDGEVCVFVDGKPSFMHVMKRDNASAFTRKRLLDQLPAVFIAFDLLSIGRTDLFDVPLIDRLHRLRSQVRPTEHIIVTDDFDRGISLFQTVAAGRGEGIVAKLRTSPYMRGTKSHFWQKIKRTQRSRFLIVGYVSKQNWLSSLLLAQMVNGEPVFVGRVGTGLSDSQRTQLLQYLQTEPARTPVAKVRTKGDVHWVDTKLTAVVEYHDFDHYMGLRAPVVKEIRDRDV